MAKVKTSFICSNCGVHAAKWQGQCHGCGQWNTLEEELIQPASQVVKWRDAGATTQSKPLSLSQVDLKPENRIYTKDNELNRVLGGGIVPGSMVLIGGEPGIGKSTLMLQVALQLDRLKILYVSGEESQQQIKMRSQRMGLDSERCYLLTETSIEQIFHQISEVAPDLLIIDSIQTLQTSQSESVPGKCYSNPGLCHSIDPVCQSQ